MSSRTRSRFERAATLSFIAGGNWAASQRLPILSLCLTTTTATSHKTSQLVLFADQSHSRIMSLRSVDCESPTSDPEFRPDSLNGICAKFLSPPALKAHSFICNINCVPLTRQQMYPLSSRWNEKHLALKDN